MTEERVFMSDSLKGVGIPVFQKRSNDIEIFLTRVSSNECTAGTALELELTAKDLTARFDLAKSIQKLSWLIDPKLFGKSVMIRVKVAGQSFERKAVLHHTKVLSEHLEVCFKLVS